MIRKLRIRRKPTPKIKCLYYDLDEQEYPPNSTMFQTIQVARWLASFGTANTLELRDELDVNHPAGIIKKLRDEGHPIKTRRINVERHGVIHPRIAEYYYD